MLNRRSIPFTVALAVLSLAGCGRPTATAALVTRPVAPAAAPVATAAKAPTAKAPTVSSEKLAPLPSVSVSHGAVESVPDQGFAAAEAVPDQVIVKFKDDARELPNATRLRDVGLRGTALYQIDKGGYSLQQVAEEWEDRGDIDYIEPNYVYHAVTSPTDPRYGESWGVEAINAPRLWTLTTGNGVKVAVIDTGVDASHPDLAGRVLPGVDLVNDDNDAADDHGHGTHVAGTICAIPNNGLDVAGIAPDAKILPIKVLDAQGSGQNADIAAGVIEAANRGAKIINLSLGGTDNSETLARAIEQVQARGVVVVAAAGNDGVNTPFYPAANEGVIGVGAIDQARNRASFSNYGAYIDVAAPGVAIASTRRGGGVTAMSGTSMASPHVAGAIALLVAQWPQLRTGHLLHLFQTTGGTTSGFSGGSPRALDVEDAFGEVANLDMTPPTTVMGLSAAPGAPGEVELAWAPSSDNGGYVSYRVLRDGQAAGTTTGTTFTDRGVGRRATYKIVALDRDGNEAPPSAAVDSDPGLASTKIVDVNVAKRGSGDLELTWRTTEPMRCYVQWGETDMLGQGTGWDVAPTTDHAFKLTGLKRFKKYYYRVVAATNQSVLHYTDVRSARTKLWWLFNVQ